MKCKLVKHRDAPKIYNKLSREKNIILKMQIHRMNLDEEIENLDLNKELCWNQ
jgi:hypothetical protein